MKLCIVLLMLMMTANTVMSQSKKELKEQVKKLQEELTESNREKENVKKTLKRIAPVEVDDVITPDEQPNEIVIGESGWRLELNGTKYKNDLLGQLGTIWIMDSNNQLQPQGAFALSKDYQIDPILINPEKEEIYRKFISGGTRMAGEGGYLFVNLTARMSDSNYAYFGITVAGTSLIKPKFADLRKMAKEVEDLFQPTFFEGKIPNVYVCTGMHIIKYQMRQYGGTGITGTVTSPIVNINGSYYAESSEEGTEYLVVRQLTKLSKPSQKDTVNMIVNLDNIIHKSSGALSLNKLLAISSEEILFYILKREPTFDEIVSFQTVPSEFLKDINKYATLSNKEMTVILNIQEQSQEIPIRITSE